MAVALTLSWFLWILTVCHFGCIFHHSWFVLFCFWTQNYIYYASISCVWILMVKKLLIQLSMETFKTQTVYFMFSYRISILVSSCVMIMSITVHGMFTSLCLGLLLLRIGRHCDSISSAPCFVIWWNIIFQPMAACITSKLYYDTVYT